jgi:hypothetical protein
VPLPKAELDKIEREATGKQDAASGNGLFGSSDRLRPTLRVHWGMVDAKNKPRIR